MRDHNFSRRLAVGGALLVTGSLGLALALIGGKPAGADEPAPRPTAPGAAAPAKAGEHRMFGGTPARNFADLANKFAPVQLMPVKEGEKVTKEADATIRWQADLGSRS